MPQRLEPMRHKKAEERERAAEEKQKQARALFEKSMKK
jgi:hypothetical protein